MKSDRLFLLIALGLGADLGLVMPAVAQRYSEFPTPSANPANITNGPDGALWFTDWLTSKIGRITTSGVVNLFEMPKGSSPKSITAGPDGALWFTQAGAGGPKIGRIPATATPATPQFSEFNVSHAALDITSGPDGALWFSGTTIGRMLVDGTVTNEFSVGGGEGITIGPDGHLWIGGGAYIYKMTIGGSPGSVTKYRVPGPMLQMALQREIVSGPDGALWYAQERYDVVVASVIWPTAGKIDRITTDGKITEFNIPTTNASVGGITLGPDHALWFTERSLVHTGVGPTAGSKIGRITVDGKITEFAISPNSGPGGITTGPDGALWFCEAVGKIGRFQP